MNNFGSFKFTPLSLKPIAWFNSESVKGVADNTLFSPWKNQVPGQPDAANTAGADFGTWWRTYNDDPAFTALVNNRPTVGMWDVGGVNPGITLGSNWTIFVVSNGFLEFNRRLINGWDINMLLAPNRIGNGAYVEGSVSHDFMWNNNNGASGGTAIGCLKTSDSGNIEYYLNGSNATNFQVANRSIGRITFGKNNYAGEGPAALTPEIIIFDYTLTIDQKQMVERYLANKYAIRLGDIAAYYPTRWFVADDINQADNTSISTWPDRSRQKIDAFQATSSKQPTLKKNILNGHSVVRFDGGDCLTGSDVNMKFGASGDGSGARACFIVCKVNANGVTELMFAYGSSASYQGWAIVKLNNNLIGVGRNGYDALSNNTVINGQYYVVGVVESGDVCDVYINGVYQGSSSSTLMNTVSSGSFAIGNYIPGAGDLYYTGDIAEIVYFNRNLSKYQALRIQGHLLEKYGLIKQLGPNLWLDASDIIANEGDKISTWTDKSGNNNHATQSTVASQPTYRKSVANGKPALSFDATDDWLQGTNMGTPQPFTVFMVANIKSTPGVAIFDSSNRTLIAPFIFGQNAYYLFAGNQYDNPAPLYVANKTIIFSALFNGASSTSQNNNNGKITGNPGTESIGTYVLGTWYGQTGGSDCDIAEVLVFPRALSAEEYDRVQGYLNGKYLNYSPY